MLGDLLFVYGGTDEDEEYGSQKFNDLYMMNKQTCIWNDAEGLTEGVAPLVDGISGHSMISITDQHILLFGGDSEEEDFYKDFSLLKFYKANEMVKKSLRDVDISPLKTGFFYNNRAFHDVMFTFQAQNPDPEVLPDANPPILYAQKQILAQNSTYFHGMFATGMKEAECRTIAIEEDYESFKIMIKFCHRLDVFPELQLENVVYIWMLADMYCVPPLQEVCLKVSRHQTKSHLCLEFPSRLTDSNRE